MSMCVSFSDVKRALFMGGMRRLITVELPPELRQPGKDEVGLLQRAMYGTRDAAACWVQTTSNTKNQVCAE